MSARANEPPTGPGAGRPPYADAFVGRARDLARLDALFRGGARLVTLTGVAGIGKTRLAWEHAQRAGAAVFCDLSEARDLDGVCDALGRVLVAGPRDGGADQAEWLGRVLAHRGPLLVVLDNFEQVVETAPATVARWLETAPAARFLVTSRAWLRLPAEWIHELEPLALPAAEGAPAEADAPADPAAPTEALALLLDRVRHTRADWAPTGAEARAAAEIVRQVDGVPLAIELAAARVGAIGAAAVLARLASRFALLSHGARGAHRRQRALREAIEWSWALLEPDEQAAFAQCAVFRGGFSLEAAEAVVALAPGADALETLQQLREKSLLRAVAPTPAGAVRFGMYLSLREFAAEKLAALPDGAAEAAAARHAEHFLARAEAANAELYTARFAESLAELMLERENLLAVAARALAHAPLAPRDVTTAARALLVLQPLALARGASETDLALLEAVARAAELVAIDPALHARVLAARGDEARLRARATEARADLERALGLAERAGDRQLAGRVLCRLAGVPHSQGRLDEALALWTDALAIHREQGDARFEAMSLANIGLVAMERDELAQARRHLEDALAIHRRIGNVRSEALTLGNLGLVHLKARQPDAAQRCLEQARAMERALGEARLEASAVAALAELHQLEGRLEQAERCYAEALAVARSMADRRIDGFYSGYYGVALFERGATEAAARELAHACEVLGALGDARYHALFLAYRGAVAAAGGAREQAASLFEAAEALAPPDDAPLRVAIDLQRVALDLSAGASHDARARIAAARAAIEASSPGAGAASRVACSLDVRTSLRIAQRLADAAAATTEQAALAAASGAPAGRAALVDDDAAPEARARALQVHSAGYWFELPGGERVNCRERPTLRRLLARLAERRAEAPGRPVTPDELMAAGWPGERMPESVAKNRLKVSLATLRKLGLRPVLLSHEDGYLLDPRVPVRIVRPDPLAQT